MSDLDSDYYQPHRMVWTREEVIRRIEVVIASVVEQISNDQIPVLTSLLPQATPAVIKQISAGYDSCVDENTGYNSGYDTEQSQRYCSQSDNEGYQSEASCATTSAETSTTTTKRKTRTTNTGMSKALSIHNARTVSNIFLVLSFCHELLSTKRTTTTREVYYHYVTHFTSQDECQTAIVNVGLLLGGVPRHALGLHASPKGWCMGDLQVIRNGNNIVWDGRYASTAMPITSEWLYQTFDNHNNSHDDHDGEHSNDDIIVKSENARCILIVEKEGIFHRLVQDGLIQRFPCIIVTGKGFPDLATRALVHTLHNQLQLPVYGICDCNPYGISVLQTYQYSGRKGGDGGDAYGVDVAWIGLRPLQVEHFKQEREQGDNETNALPPQVFQQLSKLDYRRINALMKDEYGWIGSDDLDHACFSTQRRLQELQSMLDLGYKVELEALNWLGMDFIATWIEHVLVQNYENGKDQSNNSNDMRESQQEWLDII